MTDNSRETLDALPRYDVGQTVEYCDREGRIHKGQVKWIEAKWHGYGEGPVKPLITYALEHPTYRNGSFYASGVSILTPPNRGEG